MKTNKLQVLVTRPQEQAVPLAEHIENLGATAIILPCITISEPADPAGLIQAAQTLADFDIAIFTSPNAVAKSIPVIQQFWPQLPSHLQIGCVGEGTARALRAQQITVDFYPKTHFNSETLLNLPQLQQVAGKKIALFKGLGGRELLADTLSQRGAWVHKLIAYQRQCPTIDIQPLLAHWKNTGIDLIISTSKEALLNLQQLLGTANSHLLQKTPLLVISPTMQTMAQQLGIHTILLADNATEQAIIATIIQYREQLNGQKNHS